MTPKIPLPLALKTLIQSNNELLRIYKVMLSDQVNTAARDTMGILGIKPEDGWKLDVENMVFVKVEENAAPVSE